jgi:RNA polymerase sigma-70 factor (ECF subfamily)
VHYAAAIEAAFRDERARVLATTIRTTHGDFELAEEAVQDAFATALARWPTEGTPAEPRGWLTAVARNKAIDLIRRRVKLRALIEQAGDDAASEAVDDPEPVAVADDRLRLIYTCCHPALAIEAQIALTLRTLGGLTTDEIARAFLTAPTTMAQRLVRAQSKIKHAGIPYEVPEAAQLVERTGAVMAVVYLIFNEGYAATAGDHWLRRDLCREAIRLGRLVAELTGDAEALGLLALMLLHDARRDARTDAGGDVVLLEDQDRTRWDRAQIDDALALVPRALRGGPGPYSLQAAIAALHAQAARAADTDWAQIAALFGELLARQPGPIVALNRAVAIAMAAGPAAGLALIDELAGALAGYHLWHAARADLLRRLGRHAEAAAAYRAALDHVGSEPERRFLARRLAEVEAASAATS